MELGHDLPLSQEPAGQKALVINRGMVVLNTAAGEICISVIEDGWACPSQVPNKKRL